MRLASCFRCDAMRMQRRSLFGGGVLAPLSWATCVRIAMKQQRISHTSRNLEFAERRLPAAASDDQLRNDSRQNNDGTNGRMLTTSIATTTTTSNYKGNDAAGKSRRKKEEKKK